MTSLNNTPRSSHDCVPQTPVRLTIRLLRWSISPTLPGSTRWDTRLASSFKPLAGAYRSSDAKHIQFHLYHKEEEGQTARSRCWSSR